MAASSADNVDVGSSYGSCWPSSTVAKPFTLVPPSASATATAPLSTTLKDPLADDFSYSIADTVEQMDASVSAFEDTSSQAADDAFLHSVPSADSDPKSYDHMLSVILADLGKPELLVRYASLDLFGSWNLRFQFRQAVGPWPWTWICKWS